MTQAAPPAPKVEPFAVVLAATDMDVLAAYFRDALGFDVGWEEATDWRLVSRGDARFMIGHCPAERPASAVGDHSYVAYLQVDDVDALYADLFARGAIVREPPTDRPYGMREMMVATPEGHRIMFGQQVPA